MPRQPWSTSEAAAALSATEAGPLVRPATLPKTLTMTYLQHMEHRRALALHERKSRSPSS